MKCPKCNSRKTKVVDSREKPYGTYRRRECEKCGERFTTYEYKTERIHCPDCKFYFAPVCTLTKDLRMVSRIGYCYHAIKGKYKGGIPTVDSYTKKIRKVEGLNG